MVKTLLGYFGFLFHGFLGLFLLAASGLSLAGGSGSLRLDVLPWTGATLSYLVFFGALFGLASVMLAFLGKLRVLFFAWSLVVLALMVKGFVFSSYYFGGGALSTALLLMAGALISAMGGWYRMRAPEPGRKKY